MQLKSVSKKYIKDSHQSVSPEVTVKNAKLRLKQFGTEILENLQDVSDLNSMDLPVLRVNCKERHNEWGKGLTEEQCQASAIMERIERYSSSVNYREKIDVTKSKFNDIKNQAISRTKFGLQNIQHALYGDEINEIEADWVKAFSLVNNKQFLVPADRMFFCYHQNYIDFNETTGLASGNTMEEAINHAICEVMERHILHKFFINQPNVKQIDLKTAENPQLKNLIENLQKKGFTIIANDFSGNWNLSSVSIFIFHPKEKIIFNNYFNCATAPDPEIALIRAITEAAQNRSVCKYRKFFFENRNGFFSGAAKNVLRQYKWLTSDKKQISINQLPNISREDFKEEINLMVNDIAEKGYDVLAYDLTHPGIKIPVVRVVIPGLQPNFLMLGYHHLDKRSCVTPHLKIYKEVMKKCKQRQFHNQNIDEYEEL